MNDKPEVEMNTCAPRAPGVTMDDIVKQLATRARFILETLNGSVKVIEKADRLQLQPDQVRQPGCFSRIIAKSYFFPAALYLRGIYS